MAHKHNSDLAWENLPNIQEYESKGFKFVRINHKVPTKIWKTMSGWNTFSKVCREIIEEKYIRHSMSNVERKMKTILVIFCDEQSHEALTTKGKLAPGQSIDIKGFFVLKLEGRALIDLVCSGVKGLGTAMINLAKRIAKENGFSTLSLESVPEAEDFYLAQGFFMTDEKDACKENPPLKVKKKGEDLVEMTACVNKGGRTAANEHQGVEARDKEKKREKKEREKESEKKKKEREKEKEREKREREKEKEKERRKKTREAREQKEREKREREKKRRESREQKEREKREREKKRRESRERREREEREHRQRQCQKRVVRRDKLLAQLSALKIKMEQC